jgi:2-polyprenyl-3-methyl-5-hydroxy-6-metoxy-1,4-benzoquinol methylase
MRSTCGDHPTILDAYTSASPTDQSAVDIFKGEWASHLPPPLDHLVSGEALLFQDHRVAWAVERMGGVTGKRVLELGPLEGGHSYMLDRAGAREVMAIEGNSRAFLKCLIAKELLGMPSVRFRHGDFTAYLKDAHDRFDLVFASGVLYHVINPVEVIAGIAALADTAFIWTHYYDEAVLGSRAKTAHRVVAGTPAEYLGYRHMLHRHEYLTVLSQKSFCGGSRSYSNWMTRDGLFGALRRFGLNTLEVYGEDLEHPNGPALSVLARRAS